MFEQRVVLKKIRLISFNFTGVHYSNKFATFVLKKVKIEAIKKYFFSLIVVSYLLTTMGVPVYLHYCGGELEKVSYLVKGKSCCGDDESDAAMQDNGCCKDESYVVSAHQDFTFKQAAKFYPQIIQIGLLWTHPSIFTFIPEINIDPQSICDLWPPPNIQSKIINVSVLRI